SDMRLLVHEANTPAVLYGPGDIRQAHSADEWIAVDEIVQAARVVTAAAARYLAACPRPPPGEAAHRSTPPPGRRRRGGPPAPRHRPRRWRPCAPGRGHDR